jgi:hypothetical protein
VSITDQDLVDALAGDAEPIADVLVRPALIRKLGNGPMPFDVERAPARGRNRQAKPPQLRPDCGDRGPVDFGQLTQRDLSREP